MKRTSEKREEKVRKVNGTGPAAEKGRAVWLRYEGRHLWKCDLVFTCMRLSTPLPTTSTTLFSTKYRGFFFRKMHSRSTVGWQRPLTAEALSGGICGSY